jgi:hypothetical protein
MVKTHLSTGTMLSYSGCIIFPYLNSEKEKKIVRWCEDERKVELLLIFYKPGYLCECIALPETLYSSTYHFHIFHGSC